MGKCKDCLYYRKCEDWFYSPYGDVKHTKKPGFICTALEGEDDTVIYMHGFIDENQDYCEMYSPKKNKGWIPCSEMMPRNGEHVMLCYRYWQNWAKHYVYTVVTGWYTERFKVRIDEFSEWEDNCDYDEDTDELYVKEGWYEWTTQGNADCMSWTICDAEVVAWRPLPKAYEGDKDNESN